jgi:hypothetical protein
MANHEEAKWGKRVATTSWGDGFQRGQLPKQVMEVEAEGNDLWRMVVIQWRICGIVPLKGRRGVEVLGRSAWSCMIEVEKREEMRGEGAEL